MDETPRPAPRNAFVARPTPARRRPPPDAERVVLAQLGRERGSGASWNATGRVKRRTAVMPTDVCSGLVVAGNGPPWCMPYVTATPVGKPSNMTRPARSASAATIVRDVLAGLGVHRAGELAVDRAERGQQLLARAVAQQQHDRAEVLLEQLVGARPRRRRLVGGRLVAEAGPVGGGRAAERAHLRRAAASRSTAPRSASRRRSLSSTDGATRVEPGGEVGGERVARLAARDEHDAGLRAQLAAEVGDRRGEALGDLAPRARAARPR